MDIRTPTYTSMFTHIKAEPSSKRTEVLQLLTLL